MSLSFSQLLKYSNEDVYGDLKGKAFCCIHSKAIEIHSILSKERNNRNQSKQNLCKKKHVCWRGKQPWNRGNGQKRVHSTYHDLSSLTLNEHIEQLRCLYGNINKYNNKSYAFTSLAQTFAAQLYTNRKNPHYPAESFDKFIATMIDKRKKNWRYFGSSRAIKFLEKLVQKIEGTRECRSLVSLKYEFN